MAVGRKLVAVRGGQEKLEMPVTKKRGRGGAFESCRPAKKKAAGASIKSKAEASASSRVAPAHAVAESKDMDDGDGEASNRRPDIQAPPTPGSSESPSPSPDQAQASKPAEPPAFDAAAFSSIAYSASEMNVRFSGGSVDGTLVGRQEEKKQFKKFFDSTVGKRKPGSIYMCGKPGTGKTAMVKGVCEELKKKKIRTLSLNGMTLTGGAKDLFQELLKQLCPGAVKEKMDPEASLRKILTDPKSDRLTCIIIDEMDALLESGTLQATLCTLFEWPKLKNSRLIVIGIANALDLTERFMPLLIRKGCAPTVISFSAYTDKHMLEILRHRITAQPATTPPSSPTGGVRISVDSPALELCARRVSAESGDVRKALEACRLACQAASAQVYSAGPIAPGQIAQVKISHMVKVLNQLFAPKSVRALKELPLHQSLTLCGAIVAIRNGEQGVTEESLMIRYHNICMKNSLHPLPQSEMRILASSLVDAGVLKRTLDKRNRTSWLRLDLPLEPVVEFLEQTPLFQHALLDTMRTSALAQI